MAPQLSPHQQPGPPAHSTNTTHCDAALHRPAGSLRHPGTRQGVSKRARLPCLKTCSANTLLAVCHTLAQSTTRGFRFEPGCNFSAGPCSTTRHSFYYALPPLPGNAELRRLQTLQKILAFSTGATVPCVLCLSNSRN